MPPSTSTNRKKENVKTYRKTNKELSAQKNCQEQEKEENRKRAQTFSVHVDFVSQPTIILILSSGHLFNDTDLSPITFGVILPPKQKRWKVEKSCLPVPNEKKDRSNCLLLV